MHNTSETIGSFKSMDVLKKSKMINLIKIKSSNSSKINSSNDLMSNKSSSSLEKLDDKFCGAFQEHYEYLMDKGLIETCQRSTIRGDQTFNINPTMNGTTSSNSLTSGSSSNVSYREFLHQYNELKRWLERLQSFSNETDSLSSYCEKYTNQIFYEEILKRSPRRELLNEYAGHLVKYHPHLKKEVLVKLQFLNRQWKFIEYSIVSKHYFNQNITKDLEQDLKNFEYWLCKVEYIIESLHIEADWSLGEIEKRLNQHNCLQYDIESHAKIINSVLKLINKLKQLYIDCNKFHEIGLSLQNRWHCLWIKSLEWQCRLEQEIARKKKITQNLDNEQEAASLSSATTNTTSHFDDEPHEIRNSRNYRLLEEKKLNKQRATSFTSTTDSQASSLDEDIIPFDKCEYEKIAITASSTSTILNRRHINSSQSRQVAKYLSKSCFNLRSINLNLTMSVENLNEAENTFRQLNNENSSVKTSLTESELDCTKMMSQKRRRSSRLHRRKDLSYYYSLTNVKYYNIDDEETFNELESNSRPGYQSNSSLNSSDHSWTSNKSSDLNGRIQKSFTMPSQLSSHDTVASKSSKGEKNKSWSSLSSSGTVSSSLTSLSSSLSGSYNLNRPQSLYIQPNYKSYSDYCVTTTERGRLFSPVTRNRNRKQQPHHHYKRHHAYHSRYSSNYLLSKSLSMQRVTSVPHHHRLDDDQNGNEADYDDNDKDEDEETDEYNYDNEYYAQYHNDEEEIIDEERSAENFSEKARSKQLLLLNNTMQSSSAYDTCSNLSNENSLSCSNSCKNSDRLSSGNASGGDYSLNEYIKMSGGCSTSGASSHNGATSSDNHDDSLNEDSSHLNDEVPPKTFDDEPVHVAENKVEPSEAPSTAALLIDESSTANTDVSDPHWDGYNNSPYYNNQAHTEEAIFSREKLTQPILPWDELFFELDPIEEIPRTSNEPCLNRKRAKSISKRIAPPPNELQTPSSSHQHHYYLHHHHHYYQLNSGLKSSGSKSKSRINKPTNTTHSNSIKSNQIQLLKSHSYDDSSCNVTMSSEEAAPVMNDTRRDTLVMTVNRSLDDYERTCRLVNHDSDNLNMLIGVLGGDSTTTSTTSLGSIGAFVRNINLPKYNEILDVCDRNLAQLMSSIRVENKETKSVENAHLAFVLEELTNKWKMLEQFAAGERRLNESLDQLATDLNTLREHITSLEGECKFDHKLFEIDFKQVVPLLLKQFQENILALIDIANKIAEQKSHYFEVIDRLNIAHLTLSSSNKSQAAVTLKLVDKMSEEVRSIEELHRTTSLEIKYKLKKLESLANLWSSIDSTVSSIESMLSKPHADDIQELTSYIDNLDTYLSLFKSDLQDLAQTESLAHRVASKRNSGGKNLIAFYEQHVQKLESYRDYLIKTTDTTKTSNHISLDLNEPLITLHSDSDLYKTSTPRLVQLPEDLGQLREEFKHVARVNDTSIEIKILSKKKPKIRKTTFAEKRKRVVKSIKEEDEATTETMNNQATIEATTSSSQTENELTIIAPVATESRLSRAVTFAKHFFYALLFIIILLLVLIVSIPLVLYNQQGGGEYRQFLLFNQRTLNDEPLPF